MKLHNLVADFCKLGKTVWFVSVVIYKT